MAIALTSVNAFATRARLTALGNSVHVIDTQRVYNNPSDIFSFGDYANLESGATAVSGTAKGADTEAMVVRSMGDSKFGLSLGHRSDNASGYSVGLRSIIPIVYSTTTQPSMNQQNPIEITYGQKASEMVWAGTLVYSNYNDKAGNEKESSGGFRLGGRTGAWDFYWKQGLLNTASKDNQFDYKASAASSFFAGYTMDHMYAWGYAEYAAASVDEKGTAVLPGVTGADVKVTNFKAGVTMSHKKDGGELFYGASLESLDKKLTYNGANVETKTTNLVMPVVLGFEGEANSWLTLRGSITQYLLVADNKTETTPKTGIGAIAQVNGLDKEQSPAANNTAVAVGAGLKFNKVTVDGTLSGLTGASAGQNLDGNTLLSQVGLTYMF